jgi:Protein of unknown function (DUF3533)
MVLVRTYELRLNVFSCKLPLLGGARSLTIERLFTMLSFGSKRDRFVMYPKAFQVVKRRHGGDPEVVPLRKKFAKLLIINLLILLVLFMLLFAYIYGALYHLNDRVEKLNVVFVDYDGGVVGTAIRSAYSSLKGPGFPTLIEKTPAEYASQQALRDSVCHIDYWGAFFIKADASTNYVNALAGGAAATAYNRSDIMAFIWNEARYGTVLDGSLAQNLQMLSNAAKSELLPLYASTAATTGINLDDKGAQAALANPWTLQSINIKVTNQGSRIIYNTLLIVLVLIQDFFYLGTMNGLYAQFNIYARLFPGRIIAFRLLFSVIYTFLGSLLVISMLFAFKANWIISGLQFFKCWMAMWLFAHLNFLTLDVFSVWLPPQYVPMALISWVVFNVTSVLLPFEVSNGFYQWGYLMPAHELFATLIDIWSDGCNPVLRYSLPVLFGLELCSLALSCIGVYRRSHYAILAEEHKEKEFQDRLNAAMAVERKQREEKSETLTAESASNDREAEDRKELEQVERMEMAKEASEGTLDGSQICNPIAFRPINLDRGTGLSRAKTAV